MRVLILNSLKPHLETRSKAGHKVREVGLSQGRPNSSITVKDFKTVTLLKQRYLSPVLLKWIKVVSESSREQHWVLLRISIKRLDPVQRMLIAGWLDEYR